MTKQCPSCGGICKPPRCELENVNHTLWDEPVPQMRREWQGLTNDEREQFRQWAHPDIIEAIELKLQERNT